jgi:hypothetical protein
VEFKANFTFFPEHLKRYSRNASFKPPHEVVKILPTNATGYIKKRFLFFLSTSSSRHPSLPSSFLRAISTPPTPAPPRTAVLCRVGAERRPSLPRRAWSRSHQSRSPRRRRRLTSSSSLPWGDSPAALPLPSLSTPQTGPPPGGDSRTTTPFLLHRTINISLSIECQLQPSPLSCYVLYFLHRSKAARSLDFFSQIKARQQAGVLISFVKSS